MLANCLGELVGLGSTFAIGVGLFSGLSDAPGPGPALVSAALMTATGALEGVIVGLAQWSVLRRAIASVSRRTWVAATVIGAVIAWLCGSIPMTLASLSADSASPAMQEPPQAIVLLLASGLGLVAGLILSAAQWAALRRHVGRAWRWLPANALAWAAGMPLIFAGIDLAQKVGSVLAGILVVGAAIAIAGAVVGAVHGIALVAFAAESREQRRPAAR
ncbi:MAG: hypothetical protein QHJ81_04065 [Anaerolineae bacterium]|nr:hypothetical protein [Anaerolineae bacterium]